MRTAIVCTLLALTFRAVAAETKVESRTVSVGLFKNGLAVVKRMVKVKADGDYMVEDVPEPVHGTFWIESDAKVVTRLTKRKVPVDLDLTKASVTAKFAGREVTIHLRGENATTLKGTVLAPVPKNGNPATWNRNYNQRYYGQARGNALAPAGNHVLLKTARGVAQVDVGMISHIEADGFNDQEEKFQPVLVFEASRVPAKGAVITISYLTKGMSWVPSYKIDLQNANQLTIEQKAVIKNELGDLGDAEVQLISGFPNVKFGHVTSPLSLQTTLSSFFQQLSQQPRRGHVSMGNVMSQQAVSYNRPAPSAGAFMPGKKELGDGVDIHYQSVGELDLKEGDALATAVAKGSADYERIVEWIIPDSRNEWGRYIEEYQRRNNPEKYKDAAWDSIRFRNPLDFPMTTAPAIVTEGDKFLGQSLSYWVNPKASTVIHITKALSIVTRCTEKEVKGEREKLSIAGRRFQRTQVQGTVLMKNHRKKEVRMVVRRRFSGELNSADGKPKKELLELGVYSVNERNELIWELTLKPGETKTLKYTYTVLAYY